MKLYKYMPGKRACEFFELPLLRLANPNGLNDPFEFSLTKELSRNIQNMHSKQGTREEGFINYIENFMSFGVISLSETYDNLLMWSHYADEHRGAVFELTIDGDNPNSLFIHAPPLPMPESKHFGKVDYRKFRSYQGEISSESIPDIRRHYIFTKSDEWMYEKEQRFAFHHSYADIVKVNRGQCQKAFQVKGLDFSEFESRAGVVADGEDLWIDIQQSEISAEMLKQMWIMTQIMSSIFLKIVDFGRVTKVILGCRQNNNFIDQAIQNKQNPIAAGKFYDNGKFINVLKARPSEERFELDFEEYRGVLLSILR
ncbi:DUF2971 domain-containing protein [Pseudomonas sp. A214]|uniref:DUF2971 domain-containing protein n=1 Tax=Pseudomonas sp. A214 TaxID=1855331 RepID=UPI00095379AE|nr:DUF2971 domain-containing protein [Pseudomonas sp. A214]SIS01591.1 Protein of unknown function [Pseudomonas sp. A214]